MPDDDMEDQTMMDGVDYEGEYEQPKLFDRVHFTVVSTSKAPMEDMDEITALLEDNGATYTASTNGFIRSKSFPFLTHIISNTTDFMNHREATTNPAYNIEVVKPSWVRTSLARGKLMFAGAHSPNPRQFMSGVTVHCADIPEMDKEAIAGGVIAMGGMVSGPMTKMVTHVVALSMDAMACQAVVFKNLKCKIVLPHWFDDCLRLGRRLREEPYELPEPAIFQLDLEQKSLPVGYSSSSFIKDAIYPHPSHMEPPLPPALVGVQDTSYRHLDVFADKTVLLSSDLKLGARLRATISDIIVASGGHITKDASTADMVICPFRDGPEYLRASSRPNVDVGNLSWLYYLIAHNAWTSPLRRLLHYPLPRYGIPGFERLKISISQFQGTSRMYLENLIRAAGASYTKTMHQDTTHLIAAHLRSEKCDAAKDWNMHVVNHIWLEESYARCQLQPLTRLRYITFPDKLNLSEVVGGTEIEWEAVKRVYLSGDKRERDEKKRVGSIVTSTNGERTPQRQQRQQEEKKEEENHGPVQEQQENDVATPSADITTTTTNALATTTINTTSAAHPETSSKKQKQKQNLQRVSADVSLLPRTPAATPRFEVEGGGKENQTPALEQSALQTPQQAPPSTGRRGEESSGGRAAKAKAANKLHDLAGDIALFQKESKRVGGVVYGGKRSSTDFVEKSVEAVRKSIEEDREEEQGKGKGKGKGPKKRVSGVSVDAEDEEGGGDKGGTKKKQKVNKNLEVEEDKDDSKSAPKHRLMITGDSRWAGKPKKMAKDKETLRSFGILLTEDPAEVTILAAPKLVRTRKFVAALASARRVVNMKWLDDFLEHTADDGVTKHEEVRNGRYIDQRDYPSKPTKKTSSSNPFGYELEDSAGEKRFGIDLQDTLRRARINNKRLLAGWKIYCTGKGKAELDIMGCIIAANGGECEVFKPAPKDKKNRRSKITPEIQNGDEDDDENETMSSDGDEDLDDSEVLDDEDSDFAASIRDNYVFLISDESPAEKALWPKFADMVRAQNASAGGGGEKKMAKGKGNKGIKNKTARVVSTECFLHMAMAQKVSWKEEWLLWEDEEGEE